MYYGNSYGCGNTCGAATPYFGGYGFAPYNTAGGGFAIILVLFILLIIILGCRGFDGCCRDRERI